MDSQTLRQKFLDFFGKKGHKIIPSASLVPENDPTVLFTTAGMHPLVPYLLGEKHPEGRRLCNAQKCIRTGDIDEVGDPWHLTFFEMLGNWSLGDPEKPNGIGAGYFKREAIEWSFEFLTQELNIPREKLAVSCFAGDNDAPKDEESAKIWQNLGVKKERIAYLGREDNWWGPVGETGPCGPDTEIFYWSGQEKAPEVFDAHNNLWVEIWNDVFLQYNKRIKNQELRIKEYEFVPLKQKNVDTGMGLERTLAVLNGKENVYETELFLPLLKKTSEIVGKDYNDNKKSFRVIADHIKASVFMISDGVEPSNVQRGYVLRKLIRRAVRYGRLVGIKNSFINKIAESVIEIYKDFYKELEENKNKIREELQKEEEKFFAVLLKVDSKKNSALRLISRVKGGEKDPKDERWLKYYSKIAKINLIDDWKNLENINDEEKKSFGYEKVSPAVAFSLETTDGYPHEIFFEDLKIKFASAKNWLGKIEDKYSYLFQKHQELSRTASAGMFKGGLADTGEETTKLHTAAHLMLAALRKVLGDHVEQRGSNITAERLRFDFSHQAKMTPEQIAEVEKIVNVEIQKKLPVTCEEMALEEARKKKAMGIFASKYGERVKVYSINNFSREICGGPHVKNTSELGVFKIIKEEASSAGVRRIKAVLS